MIGRGEFDFVYSNHNFTRENAPVGYVVFVRPVAATIRGQIVVLTESPVRTLHELRGQEVAFPSPVAFVGYHVPMDALIRNGVHVKRVFAGNQEGAMGQLTSGRVAAAAVNSEVMRDFAKPPADRLPSAMEFGGIPEYSDFRASRGACRNGQSRARCIRAHER